MYVPDTGHPNFEPAMELLAMLPAEPCGVPVAGVVQDLALHGQQAVRELVETLVVMTGIKVVIRHGLNKSGNVIAIAAKHRRDAARIAEAYLVSVEQA